MTIKELKYLWYSDLYRYTGRVDTKILIKNLLHNVGFKYTFFMRACKYLRDAWPGIVTRPLFFLCLKIHERYQYKYGISIPFDTQIGSGLYIGHFGGIVVHYLSKIGKNCNISHGVTLGQANRGKNQGYPTVGDNVYIGPGAKIVGSVYVGNNAAVGANCVVTRDVPDNAVFVGVPGKTISYAGSEGYVNRTDYDKYFDH